MISYNFSGNLIIIIINESLNYDSKNYGTVLLNRKKLLKTKFLP